MTKTSFFRAFSLFCIFTLTQTACTTDDVPPESEPKGQPGFVTGVVTGPDGKPLSKATIHSEHTVLIGRGAEARSGSDGTYRIALVEGLGHWIVRGYILKEYNDRVYKILLDPENQDSFSEKDKPVRNFQWKLQGHIPDQSLNQFYGGTAELQRDPNSDLNDTENVVFTFQPDGPLIDGSQGKTLQLKGGKRGTQNHNFIHDIPIGRYKVTAIYQPTGQQLLVTDSWNDGEYRESATIEFFGTEASYRANQMGIGFTDRF
ncbi:carboxypeptidase-like regulatory domain-containing protein [Dyadobacter aurulentus]|uniref:carboxypeptidase-like regulatory domain-containing protein n=1 Tax=Dyadobacter sp. UC 10 TaxID=2605428 RepID=UPI0011F0C916|nr:carboxypeptidase-like regulatory domain-containing protein [Dyadobacter sp. UC 10]KAA0989166.1 carboxypeptidase regulatory-like domain-containing protein [Dyadobacter sp. UC 10]